MKARHWQAILGLAALLAAAPEARAQRMQQAQQSPHIGYLYPAGGQQGTTLEVTVGGQYLDGANDMHISGDGVRVTVGKHSRPLTPQELNRLKQKLQEARDRVEKEMKGTKAVAGRANYGAFLKIAKEMGISEEQLRAVVELRKKQANPKQQLNAQIAETVVLQVTLAADAAPGPRELRLITPTGLSNPLSFQVGSLPEYREHEPNDKTPDSGVRQLPVVINGQIMPGDVDRFSFQARKGMRLVAAGSARELIPYLADAVPGWFQAALALYDARGHEVAYADSYRFRPDPLLFCEIPEDGQYVLEIKDALYRGREDFVYRLTLGEVPFLTSIFPLGGRQGVETSVEPKGWNLPTETLTLGAAEKGPGIHAVSVCRDQQLSNQMPFAVDTLPECLEKEPNNEQATAQPISVPTIVNGRIDQSGDCDVFRFEARAGSQIVAEVFARRLDSPLDSMLKLTDASGRQLAVNDDFEDKGAGLTTHQADSRLCVTLSANGTYYLHLSDTQHNGGPEYAYRLRVAPPQPDFQLRVVPSSITARAGTTVPIMVYALRRDGFGEDIVLRLKDAPPGFTLNGGWVPAGQDNMRLTLTVPSTLNKRLLSLCLEGRATIDGQEVCRTAVPAENMMQAFEYRHLVPAKDWLVAVIGGGRNRPALGVTGKEPIKVPAGGMAEVRDAVPSSPLLGSSSQLAVELSEPPEGITIDKVSPGAGALTIHLRADTAKVKPGLKGNLMVEVFLERTSEAVPGQRRGGTQRMPLGTLPAIPFEVVGQ
jgi:hypothetical protein